VVIIFVGLMLRWFERAQVFHPSRQLATTGLELGRPVEEVWLTTSDQVRLHAWYFPAAEDAPHRHRVWLLLHGNAGNISHRLSHADLLLQTGAGVFLVDYRGYGRSQGRPTEVGTYLDAEASYDWLRQRGYAPEDILVVGESLGGGVASGLALRREIGGLVLLSSFTSVPDLGAELFPWLPVRWLATIHYDTRSRLPDITAPVLILHGRQDTLVGLHHAEANYAAAREPKRLVSLPGDHNDLPHSAADEYEAALSELLR
jgi:fermentation-respiration switch protein FrsA (DUF1100 family)